MGALKKGAYKAPGKNKSAAKGKPGAKGEPRAQHIPEPRACARENERKHRNKPENRRFAMYLRAQGAGSARTLASIGPVSGQKTRPSHETDADTRALQRPIRIIQSKIGQRTP